MNAIPRRTASFNSHASSDAGQAAVRLVFVTNLTSTSSLRVLQKLDGCPDVHVVHVLIYDTIATSRIRLIKTIRRHGLSRTARKALAVATRKIRTLLSHVLRRPRAATVRTCHDYAVSRSLSYTVVRNLNGPNVVDYLKQVHTDVLLTCSLSQILRGDILTAARIGAINIHPSLLPKHRGPLPAFWALYDDEPETGVTFHLLASGVDTGDIIAQFAVAVRAGWCETRLLRQLSLEAALHCSDVIHRFVNGQLDPHPQNEADASYQTFPSLAERRRLARRLKRT